MRPPIKIAAVPIAVAYSALLLLTLHQGPHLATWLLLAASAAVGAAVLSDWAASWFTTHVVYQIVNDDHRVIYVGETDDVMRRMRQHTDGTEHDWYRDIFGFTIARHCWSDRQAKRIERRRITVINACAGNGIFGEFCDPLRNEIYDEAHRQTATKLGLLVWQPLYLAASLMFDSCTFHTPLVFSRTIPLRPDPDFDRDRDPWRDGDPDPDTEPAWASYERTDPAPQGPVMWALPPVTSNDGCNDQDRNDDTPLRSRGAPRHAPARDTVVTSQVRRSITTLMDEAETSDDPTPTRAGQGADARATSRSRPARAAKSNAQRQWEFRERAKQRQAADSGTTYTPRPYRPADNTDTDPAEGGGAGEGEQ